MAGKHQLGKKRRDCAEETASKQRTNGTQGSSKSQLEKESDVLRHPESNESQNTRSQNKKMSSDKGDPKRIWDESAQQEDYGFPNTYSPGSVQEGSSKRRQEGSSKSAPGSGWTTPSSLRLFGVGRTGPGTPMSTRFPPTARQSKHREFLHPLRPKSLARTKSDQNYDQTGDHPNADRSRQDYSNSSRDQKPVDYNYEPWRDLWDENIDHDSDEYSIHDPGEFSSSSRRYVDTLPKKDPSESRSLGSAGRYGNLLNSLGRRQGEEYITPFKQDSLGNATWLHNTVASRAKEREKAPMPESRSQSFANGKMVETPRPQNRPSGEEMSSISYFDSTHSATANTRPSTSRSGSTFGERPSSARGISSIPKGNSRARAHTSADKPLGIPVPKDSGPISQTSQPTSGGLFEARVKAKEAYHEVKTTRAPTSAPQIEPMFANLLRDKDNDGSEDQRSELDRRLLNLLRESEQEEKFQQAEEDAQSWQPEFGVPIKSSTKGTQTDQSVQQLLGDEQRGFRDILEKKHNLERKVNDYAQKIEELKEQNEDLNSSLDDHKSRLTDADVRSEEIQEVISNKEKLVEDLRSSKSKLNDQLGDMQEQMVMLRDETTAVRQRAGENMASSDDQQHSSNRNSSWQSEVLDVRSQIKLLVDRYETIIQDLRKQIGTLEQALTDKAEEIDKMTGNFDVIVACLEDGKADDEKEINEYEKKITRLEASNSAAYKKIEEQEKRLTSFEQKEKAVEKPTKELQEKRDSYYLKEAEEANNEPGLYQVPPPRENWEQLYQAKNKLLVVYQERCRELETLNEQNYKPGLEKENENLKMELASVNDEAFSLKEEVAKWSSLSDQWKDELLQTEAQRQRQEEVSTQEMEDLKQEMVQHVADYRDRLEKEPNWWDMEALQRRVDELEEKLKKRLADIEELKKAKVVAYEEYEKLRGENGKLREEYNRLKEAWGTASQFVSTNPMINSYRTRSKAKPIPNYQSKEETAAREKRLEDFKAQQKKVRDERRIEIELIERVRRWKMGSFYPPDRLGEKGWKLMKSQAVWDRWDYDEWLESLSMEDREQAIKLKGGL
ncbi:hypothetical protein BDV95DRAFT_94498 [Massariosphaeria phaeospora]|uniref:Uncharacterized protein n=1 Tax=Massariosphaeria phaeospora TaxID=100035 RepID=A0A7C8ICW2_9PLEO|nr:hypothetical protein BDV95DRAFT_94498 [Massariosphaeria phaeospora]